MILVKKVINLYLLLLIGIVFFAALLRFWDLGKNPPSLNWDEVSIGYNAYSILKTGRDEYGKFLPLQFRSLDDYKQPVYPYLTVISEYFFGITPFAVRFTSAFLGTVAVILLYFLVKELLSSKGIALLSAFFLSILPWHIQFSRVAIEANTGLFFLTLGVLTFLISVKKNSWFLPFSALSFTLSMYSYLSFRVIIPLMGFFLFVFYFKEIVKKKFSFILALIIVGFALSFLIKDTFYANGLTRFKGSNVFDHYPEVYDRTNSEMRYDAKLKINLIRKVLHDTAIPTSLDLMLRGYLTHFSPDFLFFYLNQKHHHAPGFGLLYLWMLPFIFSGAYLLFRLNKKALIIVLSWVLIAPLSASITWDIPHAIRSISMIIPLQIFIAVGVWGFLKFVFKNKLFYSSLIFSVFVFIISFSLLSFIHQYFVHLPHERSEEWVYGREELAKYLKDYKEKYKKIIVSTRLEWPYIFLLFYSNYDPKKYLSSGGTTSGGWGEERNKFDIFEFHQFDYDKDKITTDTLYVGEPGGFPSKITPLKVIYYLNGKPGIYLVEKGFK